jgi:hypothetical protein
MNRRSHVALRMSVLAALCTATAAPAWAYLDPGTGSLLLQGLLGSIAIAGAVITRFRHHIAHYLSKFTRKRE